MGLSIHYSGSIKDLTLIDPLIIEAADICKSMGWSYHIWKQNDFTPVKHIIDFLPEHLNGITFTIEGCESLSLCFLPNKKMSSLVNLLTKGAYPKAEMIYSVSVKTQFAGPDIHITIIKFLRYISNKYLADFNLVDEGLYWESNDEQKLLHQFERYDFILNEVANTISNMKTIPGENPISLAERLESVLERLHKKLNP